MAVDPNVAKVRRSIRGYLVEQGWSTETIEQGIATLEGKTLDGIWSYGTTRMIRDLAKIYEDLEKELGGAARWKVVTRPLLSVSR